MRVAPPLREFVDKRCQAGTRHAALVAEPGWTCMHVRGGAWRVGQEVYRPSLVFASLELDVDLRGQGVFTRLVNELRADYPRLTLGVEDTHDRFGAYLLRNGWVRVDFGHTYLLPPEKTQVHVRHEVWVSANGEPWRFNACFDSRARATQERDWYCALPGYATELRMRTTRYQARAHRTTGTQEGRSCGS